MKPIKINWVMNLIRGQFVVVKKIQGIVYFMMCTSMDLLDGVSHFMSILSWMQRFRSDPDDSATRIDKDIWGVRAIDSYLSSITTKRPGAHELKYRKIVIITKTYLKKMRKNGTHDKRMYNIVIIKIGY